MAVKKTISIKKRVTGAVLIACVPVFILLFIINAYSIELIQERIYENTYDAMSLNMKQLDGEMERVSEYILSAGEERRYVPEFTSESREDAYFGSRHYADEIRERILLYDTIEGMMVYSPHNQDKVYAFNDRSTDFLRREQIIKYVVDNQEELLLRNGIWRTCIIEGENTLLCVAGNEDILFAAWTSFDTLMLPVKNWKMAGNSTLCFVSADGRRYTEVAPELESLNYTGDISHYYYSGAGKQYLMFGVDSEVGDFRLIDVVERKELLAVFYRIRWICFFILIVFAGGLMPWMLRNLAKGVFLPIGHIENGIDQVEKGNLDTVIRNEHSSQEMEHLIDSFNNMIRQIRDLKIKTYEDEIKRQQMQMNYMQLQIKPHFYLNAMNLINAMAQIDDTDMIKKLTENMSAYLRYITSTKDGISTVSEEIEHVRNYLKIMEIRYGSRFRYEQSVDDDVASVQIPPLMIQLLIENSMKYAFNFYEDMCLSVSVFREEDEIVCIVTDTGDGYPEEILQCFREDREPPKGHIGLWNNKMRLAYMYPEKSFFSLSNIQPHGAKTEIRIKIASKEEM